MDDFSHDDDEIAAEKPLEDPLFMGETDDEAVEPGMSETDELDAFGMRLTEEDGPDAM
jgi:hypothetical protein